MSMELNESQKSALAGWVKEGCSLAEIQNRLRQEYELSMTYMDVRFLVDDLDIEFEEPVAEAQEDENDGDTEQPEAVVEEPELVGGAVRVEVDTVTRPGALVSGTVNFSDGVQMSWQLGAGGQLGLVPGDDPDYRPSPEDVQEFQSQLQKVLQEKGY